MIHEYFFGDPAAKQYRDGAEHTHLVQAVPIPFRQLHRDPERAPTGNNRHLVNGVGLRQHSSDQGMTRLVIGGIFTLFLGHDHGFTFRTHHDFVFCFFKIIHFHNTAVSTCGKKRCLIDEVSEISARKSWRAAGQNICADIACNRNLTHVHI